MGIDKDIKVLVTWLHGVQMVIYDSASGQGNRRWPGRYFMPYSVILMGMPVRTDVLNSVLKCEVETGRPIKMGLSAC